MAINENSIWSCLFIKKKENPHDLGFRWCYLLVADLSNGFQIMISKKLLIRHLLKDFWPKQFGKVLVYRIYIWALDCYCFYWLIVSMLFCSSELWLPAAIALALWTEQMDQIQMWSCREAANQGHMYRFNICRSRDWRRISVRGDIPNRIVSWKPKVWVLQWKCFSCSDAEMTWKNSSYLSWQQDHVKIISKSTALYERDSNPGGCVSLWMKQPPVMAACLLQVFLVF